MLERQLYFRLPSRVWIHSCKKSKVLVPLGACNPASMILLNVHCVGETGRFIKVCNNKKLLLNSWQVVRCSSFAWHPSSPVQKTGTSLVAPWLRIRLPMQGTQVWSLVQEDTTCCRAAKPVRHNYWACALEPGEVRCRKYFSSHALEPVLCNKRSHCNQKPAATTRENLCAAMKTQFSQKINK